ncbi:MAG: hypothetical protein JST96_10650, partial [Bacteroidetes bacterium]|nr:hypothetical protein [Bacteroidota bacterium]
LREETKDSTNKLQSLIGKVKLQEESTFFYCDSLVINQKDNILEAFGNVHINDSDTTNIYSQYMKYLTDKKYVYFQKKVSMTDGKGTLYTDDLQYDTRQRIGIYSNGGRVINKTTVLTSKEGTYYADTKDVYFRKDVVMKDPRYNLTADSLLYNTKSQIATFITKTLIVDSSGNTIRTKDGFYDLANHKAQFGKRPVIQNQGQEITGNDVQFDEVTGKSIATGNAVYKDTAQGITVIGNRLIADKKTNTFLATENPLAILKQDKDSIYITADTLFSGKFSDSTFSDSSVVTTIDNSPAKNDSSNRFLQGYHHVRIFSDSLQAVSDSLFYSGRDSVFRLFTHPIVWANGNQITGDTIYLYTQNKKPKRLYVFENGMIVNQLATNMYNQIKGTTINGYFKNGEMDYMRAKGNAESYYYAQDANKALVGVNHSTADVIDMIFRDKALNRVVLRSDAEGTMYPIRQVVLDDMRLRGFKWYENKRPKTKFELFENVHEEEGKN